MKHYLAVAITACIAGASIVVGVTLAIPAAVWIESKFFPVAVNWQALEWKNDGDDMLLSGTMVRARDCAYVPPPKAHDVAGVHYLVQSLSRTAGRTWDAAKAPQRFGPWRVLSGAGKKLTFYVEYKCHPLWPITQELGSVDGTAR